MESIRNDAEPDADEDEDEDADFVPVALGCSSSTFSGKSVIASEIAQIRPNHQQNQREFGGHRQWAQKDKPGVEEKRRMTKSTVEVALRSTQPAEEFGRGQTDSAGAELPRVQNRRGRNPKGHEEASMTHFSKFTGLVAISMVASVSAMGCYSGVEDTDTDESVASADEAVNDADESAISDESASSDDALAVNDEADLDSDEATSEDESALSSWGGWGGYRGYYGGYRRFGHFRGYGYGRGYYGGWGRGYYPGYRGYYGGYRGYYPGYRGYYGYGRRFGGFCGGYGWGGYCGGYGGYW